MKNNDESEFDEEDFIAYYEKHDMPLNFLTPRTS